MNFFTSKVRFYNVRNICLKNIRYVCLKKRYSNNFVVTFGLNLARNCPNIGVFSWYLTFCMPIVTVKKKTKFSNKIFRRSENHSAKISCSSIFLVESDLHPASQNVNSVEGISGIRKYINRWVSKSWAIRFFWFQNLNILFIETESGQSCWQIERELGYY